MPQLTCADCGPIEYALLDGYLVGDRLLEGVKFKVSIKSGKVIAQPAASDDAEYMRRMNKRRWLKEAAEFAANSDSMECPNCNESAVEIEQ